MWIDTHCHLDADEFESDRQAVAKAALAAGVGRIVIPAVTRSRFGAVQTLAGQIVGGAYTLGIHPLFTSQAQVEDLEALRLAVQANLEDPRFVGIGEIGLDNFIAEPDQERQQFFYLEQLKIARDFDLPVLCHIRRAQDQVLKGLRRFGVKHGIAHAFNGSFQQAEAFLTQGLKLGFGGMLTFERSQQIRRLATQLPLSAIVLETDAPDLSPAWRYRQRNSPTEIPQIAQTLAELRGISCDELALCTTANAHTALPRLHLSYTGLMK